MWHLQAEISSAMVAGFNLERSWGPTFLGTHHHPTFNKISMPILTFPNASQAPMLPYGQIRSRTSGFMWSLLCKAPQLSQNPHFPVFQEVQVGPSIRAYATVCSKGMGPCPMVPRSLARFVPSLHILGLARKFRAEMQ